MEPIHSADKSPPVQYLSKEPSAQFVFQLQVPLQGSSFERNRAICKPLNGPYRNDLLPQSRPDTAAYTDHGLGESADWYRNRLDFSWLSEFCS